MAVAKGRGQGDEREYIPEAGGNRNEAKPMSVRIRNPVERDRRAIYRLIQQTTGGATDPAALALVDNDKWIEHVITQHVVAVRNYEYVDGAGKTVAITTPQDLFAYGDTELVYEIANDVLLGTTLAAETKKNSAVPLVSSLGEIGLHPKVRAAGLTVTRSDGTVSNASDSSSTSLGVVESVVLPKSSPLS